MKISKARIDKSGLALAKDTVDDVDEYFALEDAFNEYRKSHLQPLTETTLELQQWLGNYGGKYYIAQRLKRKPQILRKLIRLSVRLTQLQDIGGCRIIVDTNNEVDKLYSFIISKVEKQNHFQLTRVTDYREKGRDDTGYRALHLLLLRDERKLELQIRSRIQHYWSESIERTSVIYGYHLKEKEGDEDVIQYFKKLSDVFYEIEANREPSSFQKLHLDYFRRLAEKIIRKSDKNKVFDSYVNEGIIKTLITIEANKKSLFNNWILVFDWNTGAFVSWDVVDRDPETAIRAYVEHENQFPARQGFEVVLIGSSDVSTIQQTHSHYFGIESYESILEGLEQSVIGFNRRMDIDTDARRILLTLHRRDCWGGKSITVATLKNHFCKNVLSFDSALEILVEKNLVIRASANSPVSLNLKERTRIEQYF